MAAHDLRCECDLASVQLCPRSKDRKAPRIKAEAASVQLHDRFLPRPEPRERPLAVRFFPLKDALEYPLAYALRYRSVRALHIHAARRVRNQQHREIPAVAQAEFRPAQQIWFALRRAEERFLIRDIFRKQQASRRKLTDAEREATIRRLEKEMKEASKMLEFEYAALLRDQIIALRGEK